MRTRLLAGVLCLVAAAPSMAADDETGRPGVTDAIRDNAVWLKDRTVEATGNAMDYAGRILDEGDNVLYLSGYAHHGRDTYSREKIESFNETAWGAGFGRTLIDRNGNSDTLFGLAFLDSHEDVEAQVGYAREWRWQFSEKGAVGAGFVAMMVSRSDIFNHFPFPVILPLASLEIDRVALMASYVPRITGDGGNGDVLYLFGRINLGR
jgi:palmitoyl transferase